MATFLFTWNATFLSQPSDIEDESLGAQRIRDTKSAVGERLTIDHSLAGDGNDGKHKQVTLRARASAAATTLDATDGQFFSAPVSGNTEAFFQDSSGRVIQVTKAGSLNVPAPAIIIPSGTRMIFVQAAVPSGWVFVPYADDCLIRTNSAGGGGQPGGSWTLSGLTTQAHTLNINEIPPHDHGIGGQQVIYTTLFGGLGIGAGGDVGAISAVAQGGGGAHDHGAVVSNAGWRPPVIDTIIGQKS